MSEGGLRAGSRAVAPWVVVAAWSVPALLSTFETVTFARLAGRSVEVWRAFAMQAPGWYVWALCTPLIVRVASRFPLTRPIRWRSIVAHVSAWLLVAMLASAVWAMVGLWLRGGGGEFVVALRNWFLSSVPFTIIVYAAVVGIWSSLVDRALLRVRERDAARLAQQLTEAQLASLRMQLRPHFLFNSLNAVMALVRDGDAGRAITALTLLSDVLRTTLRSGASHEVPLAEEVAFTRQYLAIEQIRFAERLRVGFDVPPALLDAAVPAFVLQPFVENAIKHGLLDRRGGGRITVSARADDVGLRLSVHDDGPGLRGTMSAPGAGVGIANARSRLEHLYGVEARLTVGTPADGVGVIVDIRLPLRRHRPDDTSVMEAAYAPACVS